MRRLGLVAVLVGTTLASACSESHGDEDAEIRFDAALPDAGPSPGELCGNGALDTGERCDDGNTADGDGCDAECVREPYCGDMVVDTGEVCDDGNNASGDGCRSDCQSNEMCGNDVVDYAAGEVCDGEPSCGADCQTVTGCGDATEVAPEQCDDGNVAQFDGCDAACRDELALVMNTLELAGRREGCDFNGDGSPDNAFASALGLLASAIGPLINQQIESGSLILLLGMLGLEDPLGANDDDLRIAWMVGEDADTNPDNNFAGDAELLVQADSLTPSGGPLTSVQSQITSSALRGGPEDIPIPIGFFPVELQQGRIQGTTVSAGGRLYQINEGLLCGGIPVSLLSLLGGFLGDMLITSPACDGGETPQLLDLLIAGGEAMVNFGGMMIPLRFAATPPDLDLDADGLEGFVVEREGPADCQPVVTACIDGDRSMIPGRGCYSNPEILDGYSAAFNFTAIRARLMGVAGAAPPPDPPPGP